MSLIRTLPLLMSIGLVSCGYVGFDEVIQSEGLPNSAGGDNHSDPGDGGGDSSDGGANDGAGASNSASGSNGGGGVHDVPCNSAQDCPWIIFESFEDEPAGSKMTENGATIGWSSTIRRSGQSLRLEQGGKASQAEIRVAVERLAKLTTYFRAWLYVPPNAVSGTVKVLGLNDSRGMSIDVNLIPSGQAEIYLETTGERAASSVGVYPEGKWFCLEASTFIDNHLGWIRVEVDGNLAAELTETDTRPGSGITSVVYGMAYTDEAQEGGQLYFEDVAMANVPIGCH